MRFLLIALLLVPISVRAQPVPTIPDDFYNHALDYMIQHPPRVYGHGPEVDAENKRLAMENKHLYEGMTRLELAFNYLALKCSEEHPMRDAVCDGRAMRMLHKLQRQQRAFQGS